MTEGLYKLPSGWRWVRLGDIFELQQGASMSPRRRRGTNPKPFLRTVNIRWGIVDLSHIDEMDFTESEAQKLSLKPGDLLICEGGDVGRTALWQGEIETCLYQNHIHRLRRRDDSILPKFYAYWMQAAYQVFVAYSGQESRTAIPNLSGRRLKEFAAPLPPFDEQCSIVAKVETLMERVREAKRLRTKAREDAERLMQSALTEAFPDPQNNLPSGWICRQVADISESPQYGYTQSAKEDPIGPKFLRITDIQNGDVNWQNVPYCICDDTTISKYLLQDGDILFARSGATTGKTYLVKECPKAVFASYLIRLRLRPGVIPEYLFWFFQSPFYWNQIKLRGAAQPNMNARILGSLRIPLPLSEKKQPYIVAYLDKVQQQVNAIKKAQEETETELQRLEQAILEKAFQGKL